VGNQALKIPQSFVEDETIGQWLPVGVRGPVLRICTAEDLLSELAALLLNVCIGQSGTCIKHCAIYKP